MTVFHPMGQICTKSHNNRKLKIRWHRFRIMPLHQPGAELNTISCSGRRCQPHLRCLGRRPPVRQRFGKCRCSVPAVVATHSLFAEINHIASLIVDWCPVLPVHCLQAFGGLQKPPHQEPNVSSHFELVPLDNSAGIRTVSVRFPYGLP